MTPRSTFVPSPCPPPARKPRNTNRPRWGIVALCLVVSLLLPLLAFVALPVMARVGNAGSRFAWLVALGVCLAALAGGVSLAIQMPANEYPDAEYTLGLVLAYAFAGAVGSLLAAIVATRH